MGGRLKRRVGMKYVKAKDTETRSDDGLGDNNLFMCLDAEVAGKLVGDTDETE